MKKLVILVFSLILALPLFAQQVEKLEVKDGEKWWGVFTNKGEIMPISESSDLFDLSKDNEGNQAAPFLVSNSGRYIWSDKPFTFQFIDGIINLSSNEGNFVITEKGGTLKSAYLDAAQRYFKSSGELPNELFFTMPQYNTWIELMYNQNQKDIIQYAHSIIDNGYPSGVLMIDDNWQCQYGNYDFRSDKFPDPRAMVDELHSLGFKVMLWVAPFVSPDGPEFRELEAKGYLLKDAKSGTPAIFRWWNGFSAAYDLSNPECFNHVLSELKRLQSEFGIDGYKFDAGDASIYAGTKFTDFINSGSATEHSELWGKLGVNFDFNEYRACWKMAGSPLVQRLCDKKYEWESLPKLISDILNAGLMGYAYTCPDMIGGGEFRSFLNVNEDDIDQELIVRSCQVHSLMPMMQFSVAPWRILDKEHNDICIKYANLHKEYGEYILKLAKQASKTGEPIVRHMEYEFPCEGFADCIDQFMLGDKYIIAPMLNKGEERSVILPKGKWLSDDNKEYKGGKTYKINVPIDRLPVFKKL